MAGPLQDKILALLAIRPHCTRELVQATGSVTPHTALRRMESRGEIHRAGRRPYPGKGCNPLIWVLGPSRGDSADMGSASTPADADARDATDWMADAVLRGDPRSAEEYAYDIGIGISVARRRIAHARALGWLDAAMMPTDAGLTARGRG